MFHYVATTSRGAEDGHDLILPWIVYFQIGYNIEQEKKISGKHNHNNRQ